MTKKHFEMVAKVLSNRARAISNCTATNEKKAYALNELRDTMHDFSVEFHRINANFNEVRFFEACKVDGYLYNYRIELSNKEVV
tara:strand:- start:19 stop:270 length:252 start_codon:yes stop_codon:yes gene_type:complete